MKTVGQSAARPGARNPGRSQGFVGEVIATNVGLRFPETLTYAEWVRAGRNVARIASSSAWFIGDWLVCGQSRYEDRYREAIKAVGLDYQTVRNYAWVARRFPVERRREGLSFQHHAEVASLSPQEQDRLLAAAEEGGWSRNALRAQVQRARRGGEPSAASPVVQPLKVDRSRADRWLRAAAHSGSSLECWMISCLDRAASRVLTENEALPPQPVPDQVVPDQVAEGDRPVAGRSPSVRWS